MAVFPCTNGKLRWPILADWHPFRTNVLSTSMADRGCYLLRPQSMSSTDKHGHQRPRSSELHCPSTADSAWQEVSKFQPQIPTESANEI